MMKTISLCLLLLITLSCRKEKYRSSILMNGKLWKVKSIKINKTHLPIYGTWTVSQGVDIYEGVPEISWTISKENTTLFQWQFDKHGKKFHLNYVQQCEKWQGEKMDDADFLCYNLSGHYDVEKKGKTHYYFTCMDTRAYAGQEVKIAIHTED